VRVSLSLTLSQSVGHRLTTSSVTSQSSITSTCLRHETGWRGVNVRRQRPSPWALGAISSSSLSDDEEITQRLRSAAAAFGCLRKWVFGQSFGSRSLPLVSRGKLYSTLVLNLLLYGCENWMLTAPLRQRLNTFHSRCIRAMADGASAAHLLL
jgi:hypothetical protein